MWQRVMIMVVALVFLTVGYLSAATNMTTPKESLGGLRPGVTTIQQLNDKLGKPDVTESKGLLGLYGGDKESKMYGWYMIENPNYTVPDLAVETPKGSNRIDLIMSIGFEGLKTEKGIGCFQKQKAVINAYGPPVFAYAVQMNSFVLRELYYPDLGLSFDLAPTGPTPDDYEVIAVYVSYPEYMQRAIAMRKQFINEGTGKDVTYIYRGGQEA